ncbi:hypothetical protein HYV86_06245 [Candidatus Woesearchaeota archaeon]|nr:hypothetical protein [Candidatus Woesearchaeota archaeon]
MGEKKSFLGSVRSWLQGGESQKSNARESGWVEIPADNKGPVHSPTTQKVAPQPRHVVEEKRSAVRNMPTTMRPTTQDRLRKEETNVAKRVSNTPRMSSDELKKKFPGAFEAKR